MLVVWCWMFAAFSHMPQQVWCMWTRDVALPLTHWWTCLLQRASFACCLCVTGRLLRGPVWQGLQWCDRNPEACAFSSVASLFGLGKGQVCWKMCFNISIQPEKPESSQKASSVSQQKDGIHREPFFASANSCFHTFICDRCWAQ